MPPDARESEEREARGRVLLALARASIAELFGERSPAERSTRQDPEPWLAEPGACFVTLTENGELRGCIGSLEAHRPLAEDVRENARAAAFRDPRFPALNREELPSIAIEVSLLSPPVPLRVRSQAEALARLRPGRDGVILDYRGARSTFLPQVWEQLPDPLTFLAHLKHKAGLSPVFWSPDIQLWTYEVTKWEEEPSRPPRSRA